MTQLKSLSKFAAKASAVLGTFAVASTIAMSLNTASAENLQVCATYAMQNSLLRIENSHVVPFTPHFMNDNVMSERDDCDLYLTANAETHLKLINNQLVDVNSLQPYAKSSYVIWTENPRFFNRGVDGATLLKEKKINSLAIVQTDKVAYSLLDVPELNLGYLKNNLKEADDESLAMLLVQNGQADAVLIAKPIFSTLTRKANGSYWTIPTSAYGSLDYFATIAKNTKNLNDARHFIEILRRDQKTLDLLQALGFEPL